MDIWRWLKVSVGKPRHMLLKEDHAVVALAKAVRLDGLFELRLWHPKELAILQALHCCCAGLLSQKRQFAEESSFEKCRHPSANPIPACELAEAFECVPR